MHVFLSWSGETSKAMAECLREWLPLAIQSAKPWFSPEEIDKGARWLVELSAELDRQSIAILCVTRESVDSPWMLFEAGALSRAIGGSWVCPLLLGLEPTDLTGPLTQFQATRATKEDMRRLLSTVNKRLEQPLSDRQIDTAHDYLWPELSEKLSQILARPSPATVAARQPSDLLVEVLERVRKIERRVEVERAAVPLEADFRLVAEHERLGMLRDRLSFLSRRLKELQQARSHLAQQLAAQGLTQSSPEFTRRLANLDVQCSVHADWISKTLRDLDILEEQHPEQPDANPERESGA